MTEKEWVEDIEYLVKTLENTHPNLYRNYDKTDFYKKIEKIKNEENKSSDNLFKNITSLLALLKDSHTKVDWWKFGNSLQISFSLLDDKLYVTAIGEKNQDAFCKEVIAINGVSTEEFLRDLENYISFETTAYKKFNLITRLSNPYFLEKIGLIKDDKYVITYTDEDKTKEVVFDYKEELELSPMIYGQLFERDTPQNYEYKYFEKERAVYVRYQRCKEIKNYSMQDMVDDIANIQDDCDKIIVDLRRNTGGLSSITKPLTIKIEEFAREKKDIIVIVDGGSFSSSTLALVDFKNIGATVIGSETGTSAGPRFGDIKRFTLPNSKFTFISSTRGFATLKENNKLVITGKGDFEKRPIFPMESYKPDIYVKNSIEDYKKHEDAVLKFALQYKKTDI